MLGPGQGRTAAVTRVAAIHESGAYGDGLYAVFASEFQMRGGGLPMELPYTNGGGRDAAIATAAGLDVDEVLFISSQAPDIKAFLNTAALLPGYGSDDPLIAKKGLFLTDAAANEAVLKASDTNVARFPQVRGTRQRPLDRGRDPVFAGFVSAYSGAFSGQDVGQYSYAANSYDAAWLLVYGATWALLQQGGVLNGQNIARGLRHVSSGVRIPLDPNNWVAGREAFRAGDSINVSGASGELDYDTETEEISGDIEVWKIDDITREPDGIY
jgi:branched-chain amino acid transport system substrate-binding protein